MEKDYSCTYLKRLLRVRRYTSMEDLRFPAFLSPMTPSGFCIRSVAVAIGC